MDNSDCNIVLVSFLTEPQKILKWYLIITSETCSDKSEVSVLRTRHAVEVLIH